ncbi:hypothetical protein ACIOWI_27180 [Streptomyces sp. NPDC087659]|uniref:hypothetical protein n=1 Tax=Streptomyces sp. NPDC087659 TaxID=3365801 RepID=UPI003823B2D8
MTSTGCTPRWRATKPNSCRPQPAQRLSIPLAAHDRRRLDLHSALTANGVAPLPGDLDAINILSALDDRTVETILHWITVPGPRPARAC